MRRLRLLSHSLHEGFCFPLLSTRSLKNNDIVRLGNSFTLFCDDNQYVNPIGGTAYAVQRRFVTAIADDISPEEISVIEESDWQTMDASSFSGSSSDKERVKASPSENMQALSIISSRELPSRFKDVPELDNFSKARVINFVKRFSKGSIASGNEIFEMEKIQKHSHADNKSAEEDTLFHCRIKLPIAHPSEESSEVWAHGVSYSMKESEVLASMHAEHIIDALGYHIYTLPSMQKKHSKAAKKAGRWASDPDDPSLQEGSRSVNVPLPLRRLPNGSEEDQSGWQTVDTQMPSYSSPEHTLLSPCVFDTKSTVRIKSLFTAKQVSFNQHCITEAEGGVKSKSRSQWFTTSLRLPEEIIGKTDSSIYASGKALSREKSVHLACMHAELVLDAIGVCLYESPTIQKQHALAAWSFGRPAPLPGESPRKTEHVCIPSALKERLPDLFDLSPTRKFRNFEEDLVFRHHQLAIQTTEFMETQDVDFAAEEDLKAFLKERKFPREDPFFTEEIKGNFRCTVILPLPGAFGLRGGVGISPSPREARLLASMHALDTLAALGIPITANKRKQDAWNLKRKQMGLSETEQVESCTVLSPQGRKHSTLVRQNPSSPTATRLNLSSSNEGETELDNGKKEDMQGNIDTPEVSEKSARRVKRVALRESLVPKTELVSPNYMAARSRVPKEYWRLDADSPDGFIMVSPEEPQDRTLIDVCLFSPRQLDPLAKNRMEQYLASLGRRFKDVFFTKRITPEDSDGLGMYKCVGLIPLPKRFGDRMAYGEAQNAKAAESLASMHGELILDTLGVPIYADVDMQRKHAEACASQGRFAPLLLDPSIPSHTRSPPPLRKEPVGSLYWNRKQKTDQNEAKQPSNTTTTTTNNNNNNNNNIIDTNTGTLSESVDPVIIKGTEELDSSENNLDKAEESDVASTNEPLSGASALYTLIPESEIDPLSKMRVQYYLRRIKEKVEPLYTVEVVRGSCSHCATFSLPLPAHLGSKRDVKGVGQQKRDAEILCWMHAERILDKLGIAIFDNLPEFQKYHHRRVAKLGRWAPASASASGSSSLPQSSLATEKTLGESEIHPETTATPLPLMLGGAPVDRIECPAECKPPYTGWDAYIEKCKVYAHDKRIAEYNTFFNQEKVPRTGNPMYDSALEEAEEGTPDPDIKAFLQRYCNAAGVSYPIYWKSQIVGPSARRVCLTSAEVPGHEYIIAQGVGLNKEISQRRLAKHILAILRRVEADFSEYEEIALIEPTPAQEKAPVMDSDDLLPTIRFRPAPSQLHLTTRAKRGIEMTYDPGAKDFTNRGKIRLIDLYTLCYELPPVKIRHFTIFQDDKQVHGTEILMTDDDGTEWSGKSQGKGVKGNTSQAYEDLFSKLSRNLPGFTDLMELAQSHFYLRPESIPSISLTEDQKHRIKELVENVLEPATISEEGEEAGDSILNPNDFLDDGQKGIFTLLHSQNVDEARKSELSKELMEKMRQKLQSPEFIEKFQKQRENLSIFAKRSEIIEKIEKSPVIIICGTTGCGKTTQVPQFILDHLTEAGKGGECSMIITQPRRLSATSIARRVAAERLESIGETCGYSIRFDSRPGRHITFCTSGVLLRLLHAMPDLKGINYLIIDEIHERDINSDFLLILVRELVKNRSDLRVILMSATLQAEQFGSYFENAPIINVEGYVHPVKELFIEDLVPFAQEEKVTTPLLKEAANSLETEKNTKKSDFDLWSKSDLIPKTPQYGFLEASTEIDYMSIQFAIDHAIKTIDLSQSSILVFLPGWDEITRAKQILERQTKFHIICLHSSVSTEEQLQCFLPPPEGKMKLILSTNIAESGVTIDDIGAVIDVGRMKEKSIIQRKGKTTIGRNDVGSMSQLLTVYASRANCVQRRGRVGRTRPGICIRLYSKKHFNLLHDFQTPEMLRTPLDSLCLQILALRMGDPLEFLKKAMERPPEDTVEAAMNSLHELGATTQSRTLTPLGVRLSQLPIEPKMGKIIIMGAVLRCLDTALTIASVAQTDVFYTSREQKDLIRLHREHLSMGTQSDSLASVNGYNYWIKTHYQKDPSEVLYDLEGRLLSVPQLLMVSRHKQQYYNIISSTKFITTAEGQNPTNHGDIFVDSSEYSVNSLNVGLVKCVVASGLLPNVAMIHGRRTLRNKLDNYINVSTDSVLHKTPFDAIIHPFFVYNELSKASDSERTAVRGLTNVPVWGLLLMGTNSMPISYKEHLNLGIIDEWLMFRTSFGTLDLIRKFKAAFDKCLSRKFLKPDDLENNALLDKFLEIIKDILSNTYESNKLTAESWEEKGIILNPEIPGIETPIPTSRTNEEKEDELTSDVSEDCDNNPSRIEAESS